MQNLSALKENRSDIAEFVERWNAKYGRNFNLDSPADQADFYEALMEMGRHLAKAAVAASLEVAVNPQGVTELRALTAPRP